MNKKIVPVAIIVLVLAVVAVWFVYGRRSYETPIAEASYSCAGGKTISAAYYKGPAVPPPAPGEPPHSAGWVMLYLSDGRQMRLPQTISASGIRYANAGESIIFWSKGNGAFMEENGTSTYAGCVETPVKVSYQ